MKTFTDIEQSKKLAEFLPLESADMDYIPVVNIDGEYSININIWDNDHVIEEGWIPCWSLSALLDILPSGKVLIHDKGNHGYKCICNNMDTYFHDNPVDACYEMIIKLHEQKLL